MTFQTVALVAAAFIVPYLPLLARRSTVSRSMYRLERIAASLKANAEQRGALDDDRIRFAHDSVLVLALAAPVLAAGRIQVKSGQRRSDEPTSNDLLEFIDDNGWLMSYVSAAYFTLSILRFLGRPFDPRTWGPAAVAWGFLAFASEKDGGISVALMEKPGATAYKTVRSASDELQRCNPANGQFAHA